MLTLPLSLYCLNIFVYLNNKVLFGVKYIAALFIDILMRYKVGSMFAGIGGVCLGFINAGADVVWANEVDPYACKTYRLNFNGASFLDEGDIYDIDANSIPDMDILTAGFPCQAFSIAGYRRGFNDERGVLFYEVMRVVRVKKPRIIFLENVKNLKTHDRGNTFSVIRSLLSEEGYEVVYKVLNTTEYGNIPQNRERIYVVAFKKNIDGGCPEIDHFKFPESVKLTVGLRDLIDYHSKIGDEFYYKSNHPYYAELDATMKNPDTVYQWRRVYARENKNNVCPTLTANMGTGGHNVPIIRDDFGIRKLTPEECLALQGFPKTFKFPNFGNSHKYKQVGNSVSIPVITRIVQNIIKTMELVDSDVII